MSGAFSSDGQKWWALLPAPSRPGMFVWSVIDDVDAAREANAKAFAYSDPPIEEMRAAVKAAGGERCRCRRESYWNEDNGFYWDCTPLREAYFEVQARTRESAA